MVTLSIFLYSLQVLTFWFCACNILKDVEFIISVLVCQSYTTTRYWIYCLSSKTTGLFEQTWHLHSASLKSFYWHFLLFSFYFDLGEWLKGKVGFCFPPHWPRNAIRTHHFYYVYVYKYICVLIFSVRHAQWADCACGERKISLGLDLAVSTSWSVFGSRNLSRALVICTYRQHFSTLRAIQFKQKWSKMCFFINICQIKTEKMLHQDKNLAK